jgi:SAM-dependent methyltransferase
MNDSFYKALEDRFRGSRDEIKSRLNVYLPLVSLLKEIHQPCRALDLGCGRGEWLELLGDQGVDASGVDINDDMLSACQALGLNVEQSDAIAHLEKLPSESLSLITAIHFVEHIEFPGLQKLVSEALRVLKPAGLLIMESPNPENILVGSNTFYIDPTHRRPLPPQLLTFLPAHAGFHRTKIVRLQESPGLHDKPEVNLMDVLGGASPDYAVLAQKKADAAALQLFEAEFEQNYGITLDELARRYDQALRHRLDSIVEHVDQLIELKGQTELDVARQRMQDLSREAGRLEAQLEAEQQKNEQLQHEIHTANENNSELEARAQWLQNECDAARKQNEELEHAFRHQRSMSDQIDKELRAVYASRSWRVTWPLRQVSLFARWLLAWPRTDCPSIREVVQDYLSPHRVENDADRSESTGATRTSQ